MPILRTNNRQIESGFSIPGIASRCRGFTLIELLTVIAVIGLLFAIVVTHVFPAAIHSAKMAKSTSNLRQLGLATQLYLNEHNDRFFPYRRETEEGILWFFGLERHDGPHGEGSRELDRTASPIYPYIEQVGGIEICPGFDYNSTLWKPKFRGASWGYGYNVLLGPIYRGDGATIHAGKSLDELSGSSQVLIFGTCAQVNTIQAPASPGNPMIEEFYLIDDVNRSIDFRFANGNKALFVFADGHVEALPPYMDEIDPRLPSARIGRITPRGSREYLE